MRSLHILSRGAERWESKRMELRWLLSAAGKREGVLDGGVGGMTLMTLLACTMRLIRIGSAAVCLSMWSDPIVRNGEET